MNTFETVDETELTAEIDDLSAYLRGVPADLRELGAFTPYEVRLQQLLETLLSVRLKQTLQRYASALTGTSSSEQRARLEQIEEWVRAVERRSEEAAQDYLRVSTLLNTLVGELEQGR